jgi:hypothetical protein
VLDADIPDRADVEESHAFEVVEGVMERLSTLIEIEAKLTDDRLRVRRGVTGRVECLNGGPEDLLDPVDVLHGCLRERGSPTPASAGVAASPRIAERGPT